MFEAHLGRQAIISTIFLSQSVRYWTRLREIILFVVVGLLNTAIDFAVLNLLIALTKHHDGWWLIIFNCLSFLAAVINSYIFNGRVTFRHHRSGDRWLFIRFVGVNAVGLAINSSVVWLMTPLVDGKLSPIAAVNVSKALAVLASLCWNYFAIRRWVFVPKTSVEDSGSSADQQQERLYFEQQETLQLEHIPIVEQHATHDRYISRQVFLIEEALQPERIPMLGQHAIHGRYTPRRVRLIKEQLYEKTEVVASTL